MFPWKLCSQHNCTCYALSSLIGILRPLPAQLDMTVYTHMKNTCTSLYHNCPDPVAMETSDHVYICMYCIYLYVYIDIYTHTHTYVSVCEMPDIDTCCHGTTTTMASLDLSSFLSSPSCLLLFIPPIFCLLYPSVSRPLSLQA